MATLKDVAQRAAVSIATVSHVINGSKNISPEVVARVVEAAKALNYRRHRSARTLRTGRSNTIGLVVPDLLNPYFPELAQAVADKAHALGYAVLLTNTSNTPESELEGIQLLAEHRVDGAIWVPVTDHYVEKLPFPIVVVDRPLAQYDGVFADHYQGGKLTAQYVQNKGHRRIGLLSGMQTMVSARLRRDGFVEASTDLEISWEHEVPFSSSLSEDVVAALKAKSVSIVVCANDVVAISVIQALEEAGMRVPEDMSVMGFDDIPWAAVVRPALTTVRQPLTAIGLRAVERLHYRLANRESTTHAEMLPVELVERSTVRSLTRSAT